MGFNSAFKGLTQPTCIHLADPKGRAVEDVGLRPLACWDCRFESRREYGCLSLVSIVYCPTEVSATS